MKSAAVTPVPDRWVLSEDLRHSLLEVFRSEVTDRLPRLRALANGADVDLDVVGRDAHTLGSSSWIVGLPEPSVAAGEVERLVARLRAGEAVDVRVAATELVRLLSALVDGPA